MANIYDIAKITSGDPMGRVREGSREASTLMAQYKHQKDIVDEINAAIEDAKRKSKKDKGLYGFGGSLLGGILGAAGASVGAPWLGAILSGLGSGAGSYIAEKARRDKINPTQRLKQLEKKLKGRRIAEDVGRTKDVFEDQLDSMMQSDVLTSIAMQSLMPTSFKDGKLNIGLTTDKLGSVFDTLKIPEGKIREGLMGLADQEWMQNDWLLGLTRGLAPEVAGEFLYPKADVGRYSRPQFRNPYRGGY